MQELTPFCFDIAQHKIYMLMAKDCYPRFLRSPAYRDLVYQAKPCAKATKQSQQEKKAWNLSMSQRSVVSGRLKGRQERHGVGAASWSWTRLQTQRSSWEQWWTGVFCRRRLFQDEERLKRKVKWRKSLCLKCVNADEVWDAKRSESVTIKQEGRTSGTFLCQLGKHLWLWCYMYLCQSLTLFVNRHEGYFMILYLFYIVFNL